MFVPVCDIEDGPAHRHRALVVPFARDAHVLEYAAGGTDPFEGTTRTELPEILQWIDIGASLKLNVLHWEVMAKNENRFVHLLDMIKVVAGYAARRGLQLMPQVHLDHARVPAPARALFLRNLTRVLQDTSPLVHLGPGGARHAPHVPPGHAAVVGPAAGPAAGGAITERMFDDPAWRGGDASDHTLLRFRRMVREEAFLRLLALRRMHAPGAPLRGGGLEVPCDGVPLLQVAAFLWDPATMVTDPTDAEPFQQAFQSMFVNAGLPMRKPHIIEAEQVRAEAFERIHQQIAQSSPSSPHPTTLPGATRTEG